MKKKKRKKLFFDFLKMEGTVEIGFSQQGSSSPEDKQPAQAPMIQYPQQQQPPPYTAQPEINSHLNWSICNLVFSILTGCGSLIFSILALVFSIFAEDKIKMRHFDLAYKYANYARIFNIISVVLSVLMFILFILIIISQVVAATVLYNVMSSNNLTFTQNYTVFY